MDSTDEAIFWLLAWALILSLLVVPAWIMENFFYERND